MSRAKDLVIDNGIRGIVSAFALGGAIALSEGHGELPPEVYPAPQPVAQLSVMASTTSMTAVNFYTMLR